MLLPSLILALADFPFTNAPLFDPAALAAPRSAVTPITPDEPTTLALALVGIGIVGAYAMIKRRLRTQREAYRVFVAPTPAGDKRIETRTRGAA